MAQYCPPYSHIHRDQSNLQYRGELLDDYVYNVDRELINPNLLRGRGVDIGFSACIVIVYPPTTSISGRRGSARYDIVRKSVKGIILRMEGEWQCSRSGYFNVRVSYEAFIFRPGLCRSICIFPRHPAFRRSTANKFDAKTDPWLYTPQYFISRDRV